MTEIINLTGAINRPHHTVHPSLYIHLKGYNDFIPLSSCYFGVTAICYCCRLHCLQATEIVLYTRRSAKRAKCFHKMAHLLNGRPHFFERNRTPIDLSVGRFQQQQQH